MTFAYEIIAIDINHLIGIYFIYLFIYFNNRDPNSVLPIRQEILFIFNYRQTIKEIGYM